MTERSEWTQDVRTWVAARPWVQTVAPLVGYGVFAAIWIGRGMLAHPTTRVLGDADRDKTILMWSFYWWPHAIVHGHDPFVANVVWAPHGVDLSWVTSSPTLALALSPVTAMFGAVFSYNMAALAAPPLAAWTTFLLARRLTRDVPASLVAGFLFGFSPYVISQSVSHLNLSFVCLIPLAGLLAVRFFEGADSRWRYTILLAVVLVAQFGISTELFATVAVLTAIVFVLAAFFLDVPSRLIQLAQYTLLAYLAVAVVVSPYLFHAFGGGSAPPVRPQASKHILDLANLVYPTQTTWLRPSGAEAITSKFTSGIDEIGGYLGIPLLIILLIAVTTMRPGRARRGVWMLAIAAFIADAMAAGPVMKDEGQRVGTGVWSLVQHLPALGEAIPVRLAMYAILFIALIVALWLTEPAWRPWRFVAAGIAIVCFLPNPSQAFWTAHVRQPGFFTTSAYKQVIHPGDVALVLPYADRVSWSMLWQAETGFRFRQMGGHIGQAIIPSECPWAGDWASLAGGAPPGGAAGFRKFLLAHHVDVIVEAPATTAWPRNEIAASLPDVKPVTILGTKVYRLRPGLPVALPRGGPKLEPTGELNDLPRKAICGH
ncbi:MAG TPA: hypothetical protein VGH79_12465 [Gaiellaceae bacterium]|jgi:hypothetical protein